MMLRDYTLFPEREYQQPGTEVPEYSSFWGLLIIPVGGHRFCRWGPAAAWGSHWPPTGPPMLNGADFVAHVVASSSDPDGVVDDPDHDSVGLDAGPEELMPVRLRALRAGYRRAAAALHGLKQHADTLPAGALRQRLIHRRQD